MDFLLESCMNTHTAVSDLADLLLASPAGLCRSEGWDELAPVGAEL